MGLPLGFGFDGWVCVGVGVGVGVTVGVVVGVGVGAVIVSDGGAGWLGTGVVTPGTGTTAEGAADGTHCGAAKETCGAAADDAGAAAGASASVWGSAAGVPASALAADVEDAVVYEGVGPGEALVVARPPSLLFGPLASWEWLSWPKSGRSKAWLTVPTVRTKPSAPATTAMRWPMVLTEAALVSTACGSRLKDGAPNEPKADLPLVGSVEALRVAVSSEARVRLLARLARPAAAVAAAAICAGVFGWTADDSSGATTGAATIGMAAVAGPDSSVGCTVGMAAVAGSGSAPNSGSATAPGAFAAGTTGMADVGGPGVVESVRGASCPAEPAAASGATITWAA